MHATTLSGGGALRITVVGGSGFIGRVLCAELRRRGHAVTVYSRRLRDPADPDHVLGDVDDRDRLATACAGRDALVDLVSRLERQPWHPGHVEAARATADAIADVAARCGVPRLMFNSSVSVYGPEALQPSESSPLRPASAYGRGKCAAEAIYRAWAAQQAGRSLLLLRPSVVFGEGGHGNVELLIRQLLRRRFALVGAGGNPKAIAYVGNLAAFSADRLEHASGTACFNYADAPVYSVRTLVAELQRLHPAMPRRVPRLPLWPLRAIAAASAWLPRGGGATAALARERLRALCADTRVDTAALQRSGFQPPVALPEALRRTIEAQVRA